MRILVADDDPVSRKLLEKLLQNRGDDPALCEDGAEAWHLYEGGDFRVIISDWMMPSLDGLDLCRRIRDAKKPNYCYFILLTAKTSRADFLEAMDAGVDDYLTKPLDNDEIKVRLRVAERILALQSDLQMLRGTFPICAWCKRIRDDDKLWLSVEEYLSSHTKADFSHSICPKCEEEQLAELQKRLQ